MDETPGSQERDEPNRADSTPHQEVPAYPSGVLHHTEPYRRDDDTLRFDLLIYSALLGISTIAMTQILPISRLDRALCVAVFAFAVAMPSLAALIIVDREKMGKPINIDTHWELVMSVAGVLSGIVGVTSIFFHFGVFVGVVFLAISIFAFLAGRQVMRKLVNIN